MKFPECDAFPVGSRKWQICRDESGLPITKTNAYRRAWGLEPLSVESEPIALSVGVATSSAGESSGKSATLVSEFIFHGHSLSDVAEPIRRKMYGPGTELLNLYKAAGVPSCDACTELAQQMNEWGVKGSRRELETIVADIFPRAKEWLAENYPWVSRLLPGVVSDPAIRARIRSDVSKAIDMAEATMAERRAARKDVYTGEKVKGCSGCGKSNRAAKKTGESGPRRHVNHAERKKPLAITAAKSGPFAMGKAHPRFITLEQYTADVRKLLDLVPHNVDAVAGVARSGLYPASMVAMWLHKPMFVISQAAGEIHPAGNGWRLGKGHKHIPPGTGKVLVVDDTVMTGGSQQILRRVVGDKFKEVIFATVYCNPAANLAKPDIHAVDLEWPHLLEWNLFNSVISHSTAVDFDGILCHDCRPEDDDDGPRYLDFIRNARPLYLPRKEPLPLIVTARVEKYRAETVAWLERHGIRFQRLVMHPAAGTRERELDDIPAYKARHFGAWAKPHRAPFGPVLFVESEERQAKQIAALSGLMTVCPASGRCFMGHQ